jgi:hypothetical protein
MSDKTDLQIAETESLLARLGDHPTVKSLYILVGLGVGLLVLITSLISLFVWAYHISSYLLVVELTGMVSILLWLSFCFVWMLPKFMTLAKNITSPTAQQTYRTLVTRNDQIKILEDAVERHKTELTLLRGTYEQDKKFWENAHKTEIEPLRKIVSSHVELISRADSERIMISNHVQVEGFEYVGPLAKMPGLRFMLTVRNNSVFNIVIGEHVEGFLKYHGEKWTGTRVTLRQDIGIAANDVRKFEIQYNLHQPDLEYFLLHQDEWKDGSELCAFNTKELRLIISGAKNSDQIAPQTLELRDWRIDDKTGRTKGESKG